MYYKITLLQPFNNCARHARSQTTDVTDHHHHHHHHDGQLRRCCITRFCLTFIRSPKWPAIMPTSRTRLLCNSHRNQRSEIHSQLTYFTEHYDYDRLALVLFLDMANSKYHKTCQKIHSALVALFISHVKGLFKTLNS